MVSKFFHKDLSLWLSNKPGEWPVRKHFPATDLARLAFIPGEFWHVFLKFADSQAKSRDFATSAPFRFRHFSSLMPKAISQISAFFGNRVRKIAKSAKIAKTKKIAKIAKSAKAKKIGKIAEIGVFA